MEVRTPSDGFAATFPKGDGFYPDKLKFVAENGYKPQCSNIEDNNSCMSLHPLYFYSRCFFFGKYYCFRFTLG